MSRKSNRSARFSGLALAGAGLTHVTRPGLFEPITESAFPRNTRLPGRQRYPSIQ